MACTTDVYLYFDLDGKPTGEFSVQCNGPCAGGGECKKVVRRGPKSGAIVGVHCACVTPGQPERVEEPCGMELVFVPGARGTVELVPHCTSRTCENCGLCAVVPYGKTVTILDPDGPRPRVVQEELYRCECKPDPLPAGLAAFYERIICPLVTFALAHGSTPSRDDLFHAHVILDRPVPRGDILTEPVVPEQFMMDHYRGLVAHAHEYDGKRSKDVDNFNIYVDADGAVRFVGSTKVVSADAPGIAKGPWPDSIYFRYCEPGKDCPPCTTKIHCPGIDKDLCVGLRRRWPAGDPALGR